MKAHFVTFLSPGTFVHEETNKPIDSWDIKKAQEMAHDVVERYEATPFAFYFTTRGRKDNELDSREIDRSPIYYLGGVVLTLAEVKARNDPKDQILISNMECNGIERVLQNDNSWRSVNALKEGDIVLDWKPRPKVLKVAR